LAKNENWQSHDFAVKMLAWSASSGSTLEYRCRRCERKFRQFSARRDIWAVNGEGRALETIVSDKWLSDVCPHPIDPNDDRDRKRLSKAVAPDGPQ
jgi:hypothetical protein